ncbi:sensor histidine kinase [Parabacteroides johnsonii]|uniref:sensor histidine kinase n=1 Tax=Parabacteroides johnsonii TaxID=387661 RepID=UPI0024330D81|nr:HAMP domain-containing sensor histidine kinase [Parabacteroides johnsonii]
MKLIYSILIRLSLALLIVLTVWTVFFYFTMIDEINDEVDDALEDYSETIIIRSLAGKELPSKNDGTNNSYSIRPITREEAGQYPAIEYYDADIYIKEKEETEPARVLRTIFADKDDNYFLLEVSTPSFEKEDLREAVANWILFLYIVLLVTLLTVSIWVFYRSLRPLYALLHWLDSYLPGKQHEPVPNDTHIPEFRRLNEAAAQAVERSEQLFKQQKQFIGNASHELQTPLAVCNNRIEWLLDNTELTEEQMEELFKTKHTLNYIVRLNKSLLFLSRIDNGQFTDSRPVEINSIVKRLLNDYKEIFSHYEAQISLEEQGRLTITMNETLAEALVSNLLKNAFIHNKEQGHVRVTIQTNSLTLANTGQTEPLDSEHIFERFYQGSKKKESTGLGLAIAEAICRQYGLHISYRYQNKEHIFRLQFYLGKS